MSKELSSDRTPISPSDEIAALLRNCSDLVMHQMIGEARAVLRATKRIAAEFSIANDSIFDSLDNSIVSKPFYTTIAEIDRLISEIRRVPIKKKSPPPPPSS